MFSLKESCINRKTKHYLKSNNAVRNSMNIASAKRISILYTLAGEAKEMEIRRFSEQLQQAGKTVEVICCIPEKTLVPAQPWGHFSAEDFNFSGTLKSEMLERFLEEDFDMLLHFDLEHDSLTDYVNARSNAKMRIGRFFEGKEAFYELMFMLQDHEQPKQMTAIFYRYLQAIH